MVDSVTTPEDDDTPRKFFLKKSVSMLAVENKKKIAQIKTLFKVYFK